MQTMKMAIKGGLYPTLGYDSVLNALIVWRMNDPRLGNAPLKECKMQRQFTIEVRVDYADEGKNEAMRETVTYAARRVLATAALLADGVKPQAVVFSDDFFSGHTDIAILEDKFAPKEGESQSSDSVSDEMAAAMREMAQDKQDKL